MSLLESDQGSNTDVDYVAYVREKFKMAPEAVVDPALAKSKYEADEYIKMLTLQKDEMREMYMQQKAQYDARASLEEMIDKIPSRDTATTPPATTQPSTDLATMKKMMADELASYEKKKTADANLKYVKDQLREKLGSNFASTLRNKMDELDLTPEEMDALAARSPKAFMRTFGLDTPVPKQNFQTPMASSTRTTEFKPTTQERNWDYYKELKRTNPTAWLDAKVQQQMYDDSQRLGDRFATDDFNRFDERLPTIG